MTNFELMALEHAASFAYTAATLTTKLGTEAAITFTAADRAKSKLTLNHEAKTVRFSFTEYDDDGSETFLMWHTSRNTTECFQMLDKLRKHIETAHIDFNALCEPFRIKPQAAVIDSAEATWRVPSTNEVTIKDKAEAIAKTPLIRFAGDAMGYMVYPKEQAICPPPAPMPDTHVYSDLMPTLPTPKEKGDDE